MKLTIHKTDIKYLGLAIYISMSMMGNTLHLIGFCVFFFLSLLTAPSRKRFKFQLDVYAAFQIILFIFVACSLFWVDQSRLERSTTLAIFAGLFETIYFSLWFYRFIKVDGNFNAIFNSFILASFISAIYATVMTPLSKWTSLTNLFLGDFGLGSHNTLGMFSAFCGGFCFYFILSLGRKKYFLFLLMETIIVILAGSRKGFLALALCIGGVYVFNSHNLKFIRNCVIAIIVIIAGYMILITNDALYEIAGKKLQVLVKSVLVDNSISDFSMIERSFYKTQAVYLFSQKPLYGYGVNGFRAYMQKIGYSHVTYSHCNFTELLANYGLIGFILYYVLKFKAIVGFIPKLGKAETLFVTAWVWMITLLILEYGFVSYYATWTQLLWIILYYASVYVKKYPVPVKGEL